MVEKEKESTEKYYVRTTQESSFPFPGVEKKWKEERRNEREILGNWLFLFVSNSHNERIVKLKRNIFLVIDFTCKGNIFLLIDFTCKKNETNKQLKLMKTQKKVKKMKGKLQNKNDYENIFSLAFPLKT